MAEWISVKDRLPGTEGQYLVFYGDSLFLKNSLCDREEAIGVAYWSAQHMGWWSVEMNRETPYITHWMSLPEPPKED